VIALALAASALIAACGGSGRHRAAALRMTPATLLAQTARAAGAVDSGQLDLTLALTLDGVEQLGGQPVRLEVSGPFAREGRHGLSTDLTLALSVAQSNVGAGLDVVGGVAYLGLGGQFYRLGTPHERLPEPGASGASGPARSLGLDPSGWLSSPRIVGTADVGGVTTEHLHALIDVSKVLDEVSKLIAPALGASGASGVSGPASTARSALQALDSSITSATADLYTGVADHIVRRVHVAIAFTVPAAAAGADGGLTGGSLDIVATLTDVNRPQSITAPANPQPESKLLNGVLALESQFGSLAPFVKRFGATLPSALLAPSGTGSAASSAGG
jgi:hypothetical protein